MNALISLADLHVMHDEPRVQDLRLAEALGFRRPRDIRQLIARNLAELERYGVICGTVPQNNRRPDGRIETRGRPTREYHLNEGQALLVCMFSDAGKAADVRQLGRNLNELRHYGEVCPTVGQTARDGRMA